METIKACPCCGGEGKLKDIHTKIRQGWVGCPACGLYIQWKISPAGAVKKWNRRTETRDSMSVALTPGAIALLKYMPDAVNALASKLASKIDEVILAGDREDKEDRI